MEKYTAEEVLKDVWSKWDIADLDYIGFYIEGNTFKYGRKGYDYEREMIPLEMYKLMTILDMLNKKQFYDIYT